MSPGNRRPDLLRILGLAHRAGSVVRGTDAVRRALRSGGVHLVLTAADGSPVQLGKLRGLMEAKGVPTIVPGSRDDLGAALGAPPLTAVAVTDRGWAARLQREVAASADPDRPDREHGGRLDVCGSQS